jgi:hypothetical protein
LGNNPSRFFYESLGGRIVAERDHAMWGRTMREVGYGWGALDFGNPKQGIGRGAEPPLA